MARPPKKNVDKPNHNSFEWKGNRVIAPEIEKVAVDLEIRPDYIVRAIFPKPTRTLQDIIDGRESNTARPDVQTEKMSAAERSRRLKEIDEKMKNGR